MPKWEKQNRLPAHVQLVFQRENCVGSVVLGRLRKGCVFPLMLWWEGRVGPGGPHPEACLVVASVGLAGESPQGARLSSIISSRQRFGREYKHSEPGTLGISEIAEVHRERAESCRSIQVRSGYVNLLVDFRVASCPLNGVNSAFASLSISPPS